MKATKLLIPSILLAFATTFAAEGNLPTPPIDDAVKLVKAGLGSDVLLAWVEAHPAYASVNADQIVALKKAEVPEKVIAALVRKGGEQKEVEEEVTVIRKYDVPKTDAPRSESRRESEQKTEEAKKEYSEEDAVRYVYRQPTRTVYIQDSPSLTYASYWPYTYTSYPYYYSYPRYSFNIGYYGGSCSYPKYYYGHRHHYKYNCYPHRYHSHHYRGGHHYYRGHHHRGHRGHGHKAHLKAHLYRR